MKTIIYNVVDLNKKVITGDVEQHILKDINYKIHEGDFLVILGPSGAGKTTLLNVLSALDKPTSGQLIYKGEHLEKYSKRKMTDFRSKIGFVFQEYELIENLTVYENVKIVTLLGKDDVDIDSILQQVGLEKYKNKFPAQLSGGEKQRVAIARALAKKPEMLFCDEPTGALDEKNGKNILETLQEINKNGTTIVSVTHLLGMADMASHVIKIVDGMIVEERENTQPIEAKEIRWI